MNVTLYRGHVLSKEIIQSYRLRSALEAELGVQCVPLQLRVCLTHFKDLSENALKSEWLPCMEFDNGTYQDNMIAEYILGLAPNGRTYTKTLAGASEVNLTLPESPEVSLTATFMCPDLELGMKYRKDGQHLRTAAPSDPNSRLLWRLENCVLCDIYLSPLSSLTDNKNKVDAQATF